MSYLSQKEIDNTLETFLPKNVLKEISKKTPTKFIKTKEDGAEKYKYVEGIKVKQTLNKLFSYGWKFKVLNEFQTATEVIVRGKLSILGTNGIWLHREQYGSKESTGKPYTQNGRTNYHHNNLGSAYKSASTDCLKKCASEYGLFWDVYRDQKEAKTKTPLLSTEEMEHGEKAINEKLNHFLSQAKNVSELLSTFEDFKEGAEPTPINYESLIKHVGRFK